MIKPSELKELGFKGSYGGNFYEKTLENKCSMWVVTAGEQIVSVTFPESSMQLYEGEDLSKEALAHIVACAIIYSSIPVAFEQIRALWLDAIKGSVEGAIEMSKKKQLNQKIKDFRESLKKLNDELVDEEWKRPVTFEGCCPLPFVFSVKKDIPQPEAPKFSREDLMGQLRGIGFVDVDWGGLKFEIRQDLSLFYNEGYLAINSDVYSIPTLRGKEITLDRVKKLVSALKGEE